MLLFPTGLENNVLTHSKLFSKLLGVCKSKYQGRESENCKNTKCMATSGKLNILVMMIYIFINLFISSFEKSRDLNPILPNMYLCDGNLFSC